MNKSRNCIKSPSNAILVPLFKCNKIIGLFNLPLYPSILSIQLGAILLIIFQEIVYVLTVHVVAYSLFPRFKLTIPDPPRLLNSLVDFNN